MLQSWLLRQDRHPTLDKVIKDVQRAQRDVDIEPVGKKELNNSLKELLFANDSLVCNYKVHFCRTISVQFQQHGENEIMKINVVKTNNENQQTT